MALKGDSAYTEEELDEHADHKNIVLIPDDATPGTEKNYVTVNNSLLQYSNKWNKQYAKMNRAGDELVKAANGLNAQTAGFNTSLYSMHADLEGIIAYIRANPNWGQ